MGPGRQQLRRRVDISVSGLRVAPSYPESEIAEGSCNTERRRAKGSFESGHQSSRDAGCTFDCEGCVSLCVV